MDDERRLTAQGLERKQQLLDCAARLFAERGYADTRVIDIVRAAGVAKGLFYWYFENKEQLFRELAEEIRLRLRRSQGEAINLDADALTRIREGAEASVRFMADQRPVLRPPRGREHRQALRRRAAARHRRARGRCRQPHPRGHRRRPHPRRRPRSSWPEAWSGSWGSTATSTAPAAARFRSPSWPPSSAASWCDHWPPTRRSPSPRRRKNLAVSVRLPRFALAAAASVRLRSQDHATPFTTASTKGRHLCRTSS